MNQSLLEIHIGPFQLCDFADPHTDVLTDEIMYGKIGEQPLNATKPRPRGDEAIKALTSLQAFGLHGIIFFQRSIYWPKSMIGLCELEPKQPRCPRADRQAQRFRMLQEVNNLRYIDPDTHDEKGLSDSQRALLLERLATRAVMEFTAIRKTLGFLESVKFNLERGERSKMDALSPNEVELIRDEGVKDAIRRRLAEHGADIGRGKKVPPNVWKEALCNASNPVRLIGKRTGTVGPPIYKVRVIRREQTIQPIRSADRTAFVKPGSTHHLSLFEFEECGKSRREAIWTSMLDAAERVKRWQQLLKQARREIEHQRGEKLKPCDPRLGREMRRIAREIPLVTRTHPNRPQARFLFSLSRGEMVLANVDGKEELLVYNTSCHT